MASSTGAPAKCVRVDYRTVPVEETAPNRQEESADCVVSQPQHSALHAISAGPARASTIAPGAPLIVGLGDRRAADPQRAWLAALAARSMALTRTAVSVSQL